VEHIDKIINIDQSPIGRTPRSNPATYTGLFTPIRDIFADTKEARMRGYKAAGLALTLRRAVRKVRRGWRNYGGNEFFCRTFILPARSAEASVTTRRLWKSITKTKPLPTFLEMTVDEAKSFLPQFR